jgi:energy-coupling factor transporter ATP-binding protein EcfA2
MIDFLSVGEDNLSMPDELEYLSVNEIKALLNSIDDVRDRAIVTLFLNTGIFFNEITILRIDSINWEKRVLSVPGSRKRVIPLNDQVFEALAKWSKERLGGKNPALFVTTKGEVKELTARGVDYLLRKYGEQAGIKKAVNALILRNTFAVRLFSEEPSVDKASAILGITDPESINRYIQASKRPPAPEITEKLERIDTRPALVKAVSRVFPTKPKIAKPVSDLKGPIIPDPGEVVFGRESVIDDIKSNLKKGQPVLLTGPLGIGKTHILKHITKVLGPNTLHISSPSPLKNMLTQILDKLDPEWRKRMKSRASTKDISDFIVKTKGGQPPILIIDNLSNLKISDVDTILAFLENFTILAATDETKPKLKQVWWKFKQIELKPLSEESAKELIKYLTQNLTIGDYEMLETRVLTLSNRLPLAIVDMVHQISHRPRVTKEAIREVYHEAGIRYRDWTTAIVVLWWIAVLFRFIALGTRSYEAYFLAGFGVTFLMILRNFASMLR